MKRSARRFLFFGILLLPVGIGSILVLRTSLPSSLFRAAGATPTVVDADDRPLATLGNEEARERKPIPLNEMGNWLPIVTIALEDNRFYRHAGIDVYATSAALMRNLRTGRVVSGASTISQQLIKLASNRRRRSWSAKLYENVAAVLLETIWSKNRILEEYLNRSHYGNRRVGPAAAARAYFNKLPRDLTIAEAIYLAGLPQAPSRFNPWSHAEAAAARYARSVTRLRRLGFESSHGVTLPSTPPRLLSHLPEQRQAPHFVDAVLQRFPRPSAGPIHTTLDLELQHFAEKQLQFHLGRLAIHRADQGAIVILDAQSGAVRAMVGSKRYDNAKEGQINGATVFHNCGSTLKPFLYLRAIDEHILTAASLLPDTPDAVRDQYIDYDPINYDNRFIGPVRLREALANSLNVPAVVTLGKVGARNMFKSLERSGLTFGRPFAEYGAGLILGNAEVRLLDLTALYTVFSGANRAAEPRFLRETPVRHRYVASVGAIAIVGDILSDNQARKKTFGLFSALAFENQSIPCKTGTSSGFRDAWAIGTTAQHTVGVWVGNFDGRPMEEVAAIASAAPIWREIVDFLLHRGDTPVPPQKMVPGLDHTSVCELTGLLPTSESPGVVNELFLPGTSPTEYATRYLKRVGDDVQVVLPHEYALWCQTPQNQIGARVERELPLRIISPAPNVTFLLDPFLRSSQQVLPLLAIQASSEHLVWRVDDQPVPSSGAGFFWALRAGPHTVQVSDGRSSATGEFVVK